MSEIQDHCGFFGVKDKQFWDSLAQEMTELFGVDGAYLSALRASTTTDPYYNEPVNNKIEYMRFPIKIFVSVERLEEPVVGERGRLLESRLECFVPTSEFQKNGIQPDEGDVVEFWGQQFNIVDIEPVSIFGNKPLNILGQPPSITWKMNVVRRTNFVPERKVKVVE